MYSIPLVRGGWDDFPIRITRKLWKLKVRGEKDVGVGILFLVHTKYEETYDKNKYMRFDKIYIYIYNEKDVDMKLAGEF